jgi:lipopolysaccharide transport system permease protein
VGLLPFVTVGVRFVHFVVALPILFVFMWWQGIEPGWTWLALPILVVLQFILSVGLAYPLAALNVGLRDTQHVVAVVLQMLMFLTPIYYSMDSVPERLRPWFRLNPLTVLLEAWREVLFQNRWPDPLPMLAIGALAGVLLVAGRRFFVTQSHHFVDDL